MGLKKFFKNKRVFITGHTGFKGSWLTRILLDFGAVISGYALKSNTKPSLFEALDLEKKIGHQVGDVRDFQKLSKAIKKFKPEIIFHLAAQPIVRASYDDPKYTYQTNIMGTIGVLESIRLNNIKAAVIVTTDKVYRNLDRDVAFKESDPLGGYDPYSCSKSCADLIVGSYNNSFFAPKDFGSKHNTLVASARAGNVIGGGDWAKDRLVPDLVRAFLVENKKVVIRSPKAIRPWQHVLEPLSGYLLLAKSLMENDLKSSGSWNFGPKESDIKSVGELVQLFIKFLGKGNCLIRRDTEKHEAKILRLNSSKARKKLGWKPKFNFKMVVEETAFWYKNFYSKNIAVDELTLSQINQYFQK